MTKPLYAPPSDLGWQVPGWARLTIVVGILILSGVAHKAMHLEGLLPWPLFAVILPFILGGVLFVVSHSERSPLLPFLSALLIFLTVFIDSFGARTFGISPKSNQLAFLLSLSFSGLYFIQHFRFFWQYRLIQLSFFFFLLTFVYYFIYASDFDISRVKYGYVLLITAGLEINSPPVKSIMLVSSLSLLVANILALSPFMPKNSEPLRSSLNFMPEFLRVTYSLLAISLLFIMLCILSKGAKFNYGMHYYLPLVVLANCAFWHFAQKYHSDVQAWLLPIPLSRLLGISLFVSGLFMPLILNKTSLFGTMLAFVIFFWLTRKGDYGGFIKSVIQFAAKDMLAKSLIVVALVLLVVIGAAFGVFDLFAAKIDYVVSGISKNSSMKVREGNWVYFLQDWWQTLDLRRVLFGYGIGASRKAIFYISAMRDNPHESNLVQTLHNSYMEYIYDYGFMCLLYFGMYISVIKKAVDDFRIKLSFDTIVLSAAQLNIVLYTAFYGTTDGIRVQMLIQIFVLLGFLEGLKSYYAERHSCSSVLAP